MKTRLLIAAGLLAGLMTFSGCTITFGPPRIVNEQVAVPSTRTLSVENSVGSIEIAGQERSNVDATMTVSSTSLGIIPTWTTPVELVTLDIDDSNGLFIRHAPFDARGVSVSHEVLAPSDIQLTTVVSDTGSIFVRGLGGNPILRTSTGSVTAMDIDGVVTALTSTGRVSVTGSDAIAALSTDTGSITAEIRGLAGSNGVVPITTSTGSITLDIDTGLSLTIEAETSTGSINVDSGLGLVLTEIDDDRIIATMNGGGTLLAVETSTGSITLSALD